MVEIQFIDVGRKANQLTLDVQNKLLTSIPTETSEALLCVCSDTKNNILAVGTSGTILKYDATKDKFVLHPQSGSITTEDLYYIDISTGNGVAVGNKFTVLYYDSSTDTFSSYAINGYDTNVNLFGAFPLWTAYGSLSDFYWGKDTTNNHGVLYRYDGTTVTKVIDTNKGPILGFLTLNLKDCLAIGYGGGIYKSTDYGHTWIEVETNIADDFFAAFGLSYDEIWIGTTSGKIYKYDFYTDELKLVVSGYPSISCIGGSAKNDLYAVGGAGLLLHYDGKRWEQLPSGTLIGLDFIMVIEENKIYVVGANGAAFRFYGKAYPSLLIDNTGEAIGTISKPLHSAIKGYYPASGDYRPIAVNASGSVIVQISGQPVSITRATTMSTTVYTVTAASGGTQIATQNTDRKSLLVQNIGVGDIYIKESPLQSGEGIKILSDGSYTTNTYVGELWAYAVTSGDKVVVNEEA